MYFQLKFPFWLFMSIVLFLSSAHLTHAQDHTAAGWAAWFNSVRIQGSPWGIHSDVQFRTGPDWGANSTVLIRPGVNYHLTHRQTLSAGYAATLVSNHTGNVGRRLSEHRIWEQYTLSARTFDIPTQHRFRLEQRFLDLAGERVFSQRFRYFVRGIIPLRAQPDGGFDTGFFTSLQNELFFNIQNPSALDKHFFDQNRLYTSLGHRFVSKYDLEIGYMNQFLKGNKTRSDGMVHILQVAAYTRF